MDASGKIFGTYLHGLFDNANFRRAWLRSLGHTQTSSESLCAVREREYDRLAAAVRAALDMEAVRVLVGGRQAISRG
jgi:adenosylcobyric acid synthase